MTILAMADVAIWTCIVLGASAGLYLRHQIRRARREDS